MAEPTMRVAPLRCQPRAALHDPPVARRLDPVGPPAASLAERVGADSRQSEMQARAALTELAKLLGRRAARQRRHELGLGEAALAPVLLLIALAVAAIIFVCHMGRGP